MAQKREVTLKELLQSRRDARIRLVLFFFLMVPLIISARLYYLQVEQGQRLLQLSDRNFLRTEIIAPQRGNILDCNGSVLATNRPVFDLYWLGTGSPMLTQVHKKTIEHLELIVGQELNHGAITHAEKRSKRLLLFQDLSFEHLCQISEQCAHCPYLLIMHYPKRFYPYNELGCHILGYLGRFEKNNPTVGCYGLEKICQEELQGESGYILHVINSRGERLVERDLKKAKSGADVKLTIDTELQKRAQALFEVDQAGAFILIDPEDGALKALVSAPHFDPNRFLYPISNREWEQHLLANSPLLNRATNATYAPASIFKLVTFTMGLEERLITPATEIHCLGYVKFAGRKYFCIRNWGHGKISLLDSLAYSCNVPCFNIARKIKIDQLADYATRFGLGQAPGSLFPEKTGLIPTSAWKKAVKKESWWSGETLSASIGQSYLLASPLQIARMVGGIFTEYLVRPRILLTEEIEKKPLIISQRTIKFLQHSMLGVTSEGTARQLGQLKDFKLAAKTGTAQTSNVRLEKFSKDQFEHAWVAVYFKYKDHKPLVIVMIIEHAGSSRPAVIAVEKFLRAYQQLYEEKEKNL